MFFVFRPSARVSLLRCVAFFVCVSYDLHAQQNVFFWESAKNKILIYFYVGGYARPAVVVARPVVVVRRGRWGRKLLQEDASAYTPGEGCKTMLGARLRGGNFLSLSLFFIFSFLFFFFSLDSPRARASAHLPLLFLCPRIRYHQNPSGSL